MINKIFRMFLLLILFNTSAQAAISYTSETTLVNQELGKVGYYNCNSANTTCFDNFTIKDNIYYGAFTACDNVLSSNYCVGAVDKHFFAKNPYKIADLVYQNMLDVDQKQRASYTAAGYDVISYITGFTGCETTADTSLHCWVTIYKRTTDGTWVTDNHGRDFSVSLIKGPTNCPDSRSIYVSGLGCSIPAATNNTNTAIKNSCKTGNCPSAMLGTPNKNPVEGGIDLMTGSKIENKVDLVTPFEFSRNYISKRVNNDDLGNNWKHNYDKSITTYNSYTSDNTPYVANVIVTEENDEQIYFSRTSPTDNFTTSFKDQKNYSLTFTPDSVLAQYTLTTPNGSQETYSNMGKLIEIKNRAGYKLSFSYSGNLLTNITDIYGKFINLEYSGNSIVKATTSNGDVVDYTYNAGMLATQSLNGGRTIAYGYNGKNLISKTNAKGILISSYSYDSSNNAIQSNNYSNGNVINNTAITYGSPIVVTQNGITKNYSKTQSFYQDVPSTTNFKVGTQTIAKEAATYSGDNLSTLKDEEGNSYSYTYDSSGWLSSTTRNSVITNFTWDKYNNLLLSSYDNKRNVSYSYNNDGLLINKSIATSGSGTRNWSYTWTSLGKIVINSYDNHGNPTSVTLPSGLVKTYTYNDIGQVLSETIDAATTTYTYDADGLLTQVQLPTGYTLNYIYDSLGRRTSLSDNLNGSITYAYDDNNKVTNESVYANSVLQSTSNRIFDGLGRLTQAWKANSNEKYSYTYDTMSNFRPASETNPRAEVKRWTYNASLITNESGYGRSLGLGYDSDDNNTSMTANGVDYTLTYNEFAELLSSTNLNTGTDNYSYDVQNRINTKTDAAGISHVTQYDLLGRILSVDSSGMQKLFIYDTNFIGKLTSAQNGSTLVTYTYDNLGRVATKNQAVNGVNKTISYQYDSIGQLIKTTYPSGLEINYTYNNGLVTGIDTTNAGNIIQNIGYQYITFNPTSWTWGNNLTRAKAIDTSGKITSLNDGPLNQSYNLDGIFNVLSINDSGINKYYEYIGTASALTRMYGDAGIVKYGIGSKTERSSITDFNNKSYIYNYVYASNKLDYYYDNNSGISYKSTYDSKGNTLTNSLGVFTYDNQNNMNTATANGQAFTYTYNAFDERVRKAGSVVDKTFIYNDNHQLIGEYDATSSTEYIYFGSTSIALYKNGQLFFIHTDHLETPRAITNTSGSVVWKWDNIDPFGKNAPINLGLDFNLRFTGQYADTETGLFYNYYKYYNPTTGRYMQVDPIGIKGGVDTYGYVGNNPINSVDPLGLTTRVLVVDAETIPAPGHVAIEINGTTYDLNPAAKASVANLMYTPASYNPRSIEDFVNYYYNKYGVATNAYELNITQEQENNLLNYLKNIKPKNYSGTSIGADNCATFEGNALQKYWNLGYTPLYLPSLEKLRLEALMKIGQWTNKVLVKNSRIYNKGYEK